MFRDQLVNLLGPHKTIELICEAESYAKKILSLAKQHFKVTHNSWVVNEGGFERIVQTLCCYALAADTWDKGFKEYWNELKKEYRYDNRTKLVSLDHLLEVSGEYASLAEGASSPLSPFEGVALSEYAPLPQDVSFWNWLEHRPDKFQEVLWTWCETRDHKVTAELTGVTADYSRSVYRQAKVRALRAV